MLRRSVLAPVLAPVLAVLVLAGCGGDDATSDPGDGSYNQVDLEFAQGMVAHHEQAIEMSEYALDPNVGARAEVVELAERIIAGQDPEIQQMTAWLTARGESVEMDTSGGHDMSSMEGMMTADEMDSLAGSTGAPFDEMWLQMMIEHHRGAISMADTALEGGVDPEIRSIAEGVESVQQAEIAEMEALLAS